MQHAHNDDEPAFDVEGYLDEAQSDAYRGDGWEMWALIALVVVVAFMFFGGIRGVILAIVWIVAVAFLIIFRSTIAAVLTIIAAFVLTFIGIIVLFQAV